MLKEYPDNCMIIRAVCLYVKRKHRRVGKDGWSQTKMCKFLLVFVTPWGNYLKEAYQKQHTVEAYLVWIEAMNSSNSMAVEHTRCNHSTSTGCCKSVFAFGHPEPSGTSGKAYLPCGWDIPPVATVASWAMGKRHFRVGEVFWRAGRASSGPGEGRDGRVCLCCILTPILGLKALHVAIWFCSSDLAGSDQSNPIV